ncbi:MAG: FAD/NAD(P)-binding protein [Acetobacteraceae bacterium]|nr:FAD/NAD(P)-binding protein [Acetobacteraceae bacterium]
MSDATADPMLPQPGHVKGRRRDGPDVWTLEIEPERAPASFAPGQFNMLTAFGIGEVAISMSGDPADPGRLVHTIRSVGVVSGALAQLPRGASIGLRGPFGAGWPMADLAGRDVVVVAGGLGLAPLRPALYRLLGERDRYGRVILLCGARSPGDILFRRDLESWRRRTDIDVRVTVDRGDADWKGDVGVVTLLIPRVALDPARVTALVCGPEVMMRFAVTALREVGVLEEAIYLSMERNMKCAVGFCGHCQWGTTFVCRDGPVFRYDRVRDLLASKEI